MNTAVATRSWSERLVVRAVAGGARRRTLTGFALLSVGDFFLPALPTQTTVVALSLLQPRRGVWIVSAFAAAAAVGVLLMALLVGLLDGYPQRLAEAVAPEAWAEAMALLRLHGLWIVLGASLLPTPPRLLVAAALLAGIPAGHVAAAVFIGKTLWFGAVVALLVAVPDRLHRVPWLGRRILALRDLQRRLSSERTP